MPTSQAFQLDEARARTNAATIVRAVGRHGQQRAAICFGVDHTTVSRWISEKAEKWFGFSLPDFIGRLLALYGLKVVPIEMKCYSEPEIEAIFQLARARMTEMSSSRELMRDHEWEEGV